MKNFIHCPKCNSEIYEVHVDLSCHAHNDRNQWRKEGRGESYSVFRRFIIEEKDKVNVIK